jgi:hypothetical protein
MAIQAGEAVEPSLLTLVRELEEVRRVALVAAAKADERWVAYLRALDLQTNETARRLEHLNGEAARIAEERQVVTAQMRREMELGFGVAHRDTSSVREALATFIAEQRGVNKGMNLIWTIVVATLTISIAAVGVWISSVK